jgi:hypothetical protein
MLSLVLGFHLGPRWRCRGRGLKRAEFCIRDVLFSTPIPSFRNLITPIAGAPTGNARLKNGIWKVGNGKWKIVGLLRNLDLDLHASGSWQLACLIRIPQAIRSKAELVVEVVALAQGLLMLITTTAD